MVRPACKVNGKGRIFTPNDIKIPNILGATGSIEPISYGNVSGWVAGWLSVTAGIVSKRLNLSYNFFDHLVDPS